MRKIILVLVAAFALTALIPMTASAFECPRHFRAAQAAIDKVTKNMKGMGSMAKAQMALVHSLVDDAKTWLSSARHNHKKPQGIFDHARSIAKADTALGFAGAADMFLSKLMK